MSIREGITEILRQPIKIDINIKGFRPELKRDCKQADQIITLIKAELEKIENPYSEDVFPTTTEQAGEYMRERLGDEVTTALSGAICRLGYSNAIRNVLKLLEEK